MKAQRSFALLLVSVVLAGCAGAPHKPISADRDTLWRACLVTTSLEGFTLQDSDPDEGRIIAQRRAFSRDGVMVSQRLDILLVEHRKGYRAHVRVFQGAGAAPLMESRGPGFARPPGRPRPSGGRKYAGSAALPLRDLYAEQLVRGAIGKRLGLVKAMQEKRPERTP